MLMIKIQRMLLKDMLKTASQVQTDKDQTKSYFFFLAVPNSIAYVIIESSI